MRPPPTCCNNAAQPQQSLPITAAAAPCATAAAAAVEGRGIAACHRSSGVFSSRSRCCCCCRCGGGPLSTSSYRPEVHGPVPAVLHELRGTAVHVAPPGWQLQGAAASSGTQRRQPPLGLCRARRQATTCRYCACKAEGCKPASHPKLPDWLHQQQPIQPKQTLPRAWHPRKIRPAPASPRTQSGAGPPGSAWTPLGRGSDLRRCIWAGRGLAWTGEQATSAGAQIQGIQGPHAWTLLGRGLGLRRCIWVWADGLVRATK